VTSPPPARARPPRPTKRAGPPAWLTGWSQLISNAVVVLGAGFAVWQVLELRADRGRENAMQYVMLMHEEPYAQIALDLSVAMQEGTAGDDARLSLVNIQKLGDLYLSAITCRDSGVCDKKTVDIHFRPTIAGFYNLTYNDELVRLSCRLSLKSNEYGSHFHAYLVNSGGKNAPRVPVPTRKCE
jgi:hypothetical protein